MVSRERLEFALGNVKGSQWQKFEELASAFLAMEFDSHRTMASPGGDGGRDAELYSFDGTANVLIQYSVQADWRTKINDTFKRLKETFQEVTSLIYLTSVPIGARADDLKKAYRQKGIHLDVRDQSWFLDRMNADENRREASAAFAREIVDPILVDKRVLTDAPGLSGRDARTALVFLEMQAKDEGADKGLTKACFESLVKAALHGTSSDLRKTRMEIYEAVHGFLPQHSRAQLKPFIDGALNRMSKSKIKHYLEPDEFHLAFEESERIKDRVAGLRLLSEAIRQDILDAIGEDPSINNEARARTCDLVRKAIEIYFYRLGEEFAQCVTEEKDIPLHADLLGNVVIEVAPKGKINSDTDWVGYLRRITSAVLTNPSDETTEMFRVLSTSYTLFAFLAEVPDVQRATKRLFARGTFWLDTTALLPLVAEQAFPEADRPFTELMVQLKRSGLKTRVTWGVLEEIESHLNLCRTFVKKRSSWQGRVPYVYQRYAIAGGRAETFSSWVEEFMGDHRPLDDLAEYLADLADIQVAKPISTSDLDQEVVDAVREYWHQIQDERRDVSQSASNKYRLAEHDIENYLSVLAQRRSEVSKSAIGYTSWLVTLDSAAWSLLGKIDESAREKIRHTPVISIDFLLKYLAFGPRRDLIDTSSRGHTRVFAATVYENVPVELVAVAEQVREDCKGLSERLIQRKIRDGMDQQRMKLGQVQRNGLDDLGNSVFEGAY